MCSCDTLVACTSVQDFILAFYTTLTRCVHGHFACFHPVFHTFIVAIFRLPHGDTLAFCIADVIAATTIQHQHTFLLRAEELRPTGDIIDALSQRCRVNRSVSRPSLRFSVAEWLVDFPHFSVADASLPDPSVT
jgi:hypothetical protein